MALAEHGAEAQAEFREIHDVLGGAFDADTVFKKITSKYPVDPLSPEAFKRLLPGVYSSDEGHRFRLNEDQSVGLFQWEGRSTYIIYPTVEEFLKIYKLSLTNLKPRK